MKNNMKITTLIFDLGGVIINIDPSRSINEFKSLSNNNNLFDGLDYKNNQASSLLNFFFDFEKGLIDEVSFRNRLNKIGNFNLNKQRIENIWNKVIVSINFNLIDLILKLNNHYKVMILSNTNSIHERYYKSICLKKYGFDFKVLFNKVYYSHELNLRKPEPEIYKLILRENKLDPKEIIFFDDIIENIIAAEKVGFNTFKVSYIDTLEKYLKTIFVI